MFPLLGPGSFGSGPSACRLREAIGRTARSRASLALLGRRTARDDAAACQDEPIAAPFLNSQDAPCPRDKISGRYLLRTRATVNHRDAVPWILDAIVSEQRPRVVGFGCFIRGGTVRPCHGTVRWFDVRKGYGFLKPDDDGVDVLSRIPSLANGSEVRSRLRFVTASWMAWSSAMASVKVWWAR